MRCKDCRYLDRWHDLNFFCCDVTGKVLQDNYRTEFDGECICEKERKERERYDEIRLPWRHSHSK